MSGGRPAAHSWSASGYGCGTDIWSSFVPMCRSFLITRTMRWIGPRGSKSRGMANSGVAAEREKKTARTSDRARLRMAKPS